MKLLSCLFVSLSLLVIRHVVTICSVFLYLEHVVIKVQDSIRSDYQNVEQDSDTRRTAKPVKTVAHLKCLGQTIVQIYLAIIVHVFICVHMHSTLSVPN
jgi:hypothetical protein